VPRPSAEAVASHCARSSFCSRGHFDGDANSPDGHLPTFASTASAQSDIDYPWSVEFGIGWDNSISGNINSSGIGSINNQATVILKNSYYDVYGTGLHLRFGGGYLIDEVSEGRRRVGQDRECRPYAEGALGGNVGVLWQVAEQVGAFGQIGLRWVSGMSEVDGLAGTGLETIND
jgi:hypothetical protein